MASRISWRELVPASSSIPAEGGKIAHGRLVADARRDCVLYLPGWSGTSVGLSFRMTADGWVPDNTQPHTLPREPAQPPYAFWDESRGGVAYWMLISEGMQSVPHGLLIRPEGVTRIETTGEGPVGPFIVTFEPGVLFGYDVGRGVTVAMTAEAVFELDAAGVWRRVAAIEPRLLPATLVPTGRGAMYDAAGQRLLFIATDFSNVMPVVLAWDGKELRPIPTDSMPRRMLWNGPTYFVRPGGPPTYLRSGEGTAYELRGETWVEAGTPGGRTPVFRGVIAAAARSGPIVLGPGSYEKPGSTADEQVFYRLGEGRCTRQGASQRGPGEAAQSAPRLLAASRDGVFALLGSGELRRLRPSAEGLSAASPERANAAAFAVGCSGLLCVTRTGALQRFREGQWSEIAPPERGLAGRTDLRLAHDPATDRCVAWGGRTGTTLHYDTWIASAGKWACIATEDPFLFNASRKRDGRDKRSARHHLVYDPGLRHVLLFSDGEVVALQPSGWVPVPCLDLRTTLRTGEYAVLPADGEILVLGFSEGGLTRFDAVACSYLENAERPDGSTHLASAIEDHPAHADLVFDPTTHELLLFGDAELRPTHALPLERAFARARAQGPRAGFAQRNLLLPSVIEDAVAQVVDRAVMELTSAEVQRLTGLSLGNCPDFLRRELGIRWWRQKGETTLAAAREAQANLATSADSGEQDADPEGADSAQHADRSGDDLAAKVSPDDCLEPFLSQFVARLQPPWP